MSIAPVLVLLVCGVYLVDAVNLNQACANNGECSVSNSECKMVYSECTKGTCMCSDGYDADGTTDTCKPVKNNGQTCVVATDKCAGGTTCSGSPLTCSCATGKEYNTNLKMCVTTGQQVEGATCADETKCYLGGTMSECVAATGTTTPKYCRCKSGYVKDTSGACRKPMVSETCTTTVGCTSFKMNNADASQVDAACLVTSAGASTYSCQCPTTADTKSVDSSGMTYSMCLTKYTGTAIANGAACTASNACDSDMCVQCPGVSSSVCVTLPGSNHGETVKVQIGVLLGVVVLPFLTRLFF